MRQRTISLDPGETKNEEARSASMKDELFNEMQGVLSKGCLGSPSYVFHHAGQPVRKFEKAWNTACQKVGVKGKLFHAFRRTAARNMIRSGIPERVAMTITGHKTRSVFDRYNIVSDQDLKEAARKHQIFIESQNGYKTVTIEDSEKPKVLNL
jgi:integrase